MSKLGQNYIEEHFNTPDQFHLSSHSAALDEVSKGMASLIMDKLEESLGTSRNTTKTQASSNATKTQRTHERNAKRQKLEDIVPKVDYDVHITSPGPYVIDGTELLTMTCKLP